MYPSQGEQDLITVKIEHTNQIKLSQLNLIETIIELLSKPIKTELI